ncbi:MAG: PEP-CTERM sorting domain-containing protein [Sedimentisphaerales bacterium]|nr:PEP-CTERM sorting domain-containing protein [Sedimentisphaerales bacterium]
MKNCLLAMVILMVVVATGAKADYIDYSHSIWQWDTVSCWLAPESPEPRRNFTASGMYGGNQRWSFVVDGSGMHDGTSAAFDGPYHDNCSTYGRSVWHTRYTDAENNPAGIPGSEAIAWAAWDFADLFELGVMDVWNFNYNVSGTDLTSRGFNEVRIHYRATESDPWTELVGSAGDTHWNDTTSCWDFEKATGEVNYAANTNIDFGGVEAQYVVLTCLSTHGDNTYPGLSEVRFEGTLVPEPLSLGLLAIGGLVTLRRRR